MNEEFMQLLIALHKETSNLLQIAETTFKE